MFDSQLEPAEINIPTITNSVGNLGFIEESLLPFKIKRVYFIYDVPQGAQRGSHSHKKLFQFILCLSGAFTLKLQNSTKEFVFDLRSRSSGILVPPGYWRTLDNFKENTVCVVLASEIYMESDYIRNFNEFIEWRTANG